MRLTLVLLGSIAVIGCSGAPFTFIGEEKGDADVLPDVGAVGVDTDSSRVDALAPSASDGSGEVTAKETSADDRETAPEGDAQDELVEGPMVVDAGDAAVHDASMMDVAVTPEPVPEASTKEACTPPDAFIFGCGPPIYVNAPTQYCVLNQGPDTAQVMQNPCACEYDCACLLTSGARLCPGGETYQSCSIGTTGGMVVVCR